MPGESEAGPGRQWRRLEICAGRQELRVWEKKIGRSAWLMQPASTHVIPFGLPKALLLFQLDTGFLHMAAGSELRCDAEQVPCFQMAWGGGWVGEAIFSGDRICSLRRYICLRAHRGSCLAFPMIS